MYISKATKTYKNNFLLTITSRHFSKCLLLLFVHVKRLLAAVSPPDKDVIKFA